MLHLVDVTFLSFHVKVTEDTRASHLLLFYTSLLSYIIDTTDLCVQGHRLLAG